LKRIKKNEIFQKENEEGATPPTAKRINFSWICNIFTSMFVSFILLNKKYFIPFSFLHFGSF
jgi:hypothetical protein